jgi:hypothetical protein
VAMCLLGVMASSALAHEFLASKYHVTPSEATPLHLLGKTAPPEEEQINKGTGEGVQSFTFGKYPIKCEKGTSKGLITSSPTDELNVKTTYAKCGYYPIKGQSEHVPATIKGGIAWKLIVNGAAKLEPKEEAEELEYGPESKIVILPTSFQVKITAGKFCTINVPEQELPAKAIKSPNEEYNALTYSNEEFEIENQTPSRLRLFPGGIQHRLVVAADLTKVKFKFGEETQCFEDEPKEELNSGIIKGVQTYEVVSGNIEYK